MGRTRILILAVAAVAAIGLAFVMRGLMGGSAPAPVQTVAAPPPARPMARVLVAARDLTPGTRLTAEDLRWQEFPVEAVTAAFVTDGAVAGVQPAAATPAPEPARAGPGQPPAPAGGAAQGDLAQRASAQTQSTTESFMSTLTGAPGEPMAALVGMVVRETIGQGEPITERKIVRGGDSGYMAVVLQPGMRAMAVPVSVETAAGGFILPGDRVDVIMSRQQQSGASGGPEFAAGTVLRNIRVLAIDQTVQPAPETQAQVGATATLEVGAREAEVLALARAQGQLALVLRSYADMDDRSGVGSLAGQNSGPPRPVRVWRGGQVTEIAQR